MVKIKLTHTRLHATEIELKLPLPRKCSFFNPIVGTLSENHKLLLLLMLLLLLLLLFLMP